MPPIPICIRPPSGKVKIGPSAEKPSALTNYPLADAFEQPITFAAQMRPPEHPLAEKEAGLPEPLSLSSNTVNLRS